MVSQSGNITPAPPHYGYNDPDTLLIFGTSHGTGKTVMLRSAVTSWVETGRTAIVSGQGSSMDDLVELRRSLGAESY